MTIPKKDFYLMRTVRCIISGRVQGVFFRASTKDHAEELDITGSARNLPQNQVEVIATGDSANIDRLIEWLHKGPAGAEVTSVSIDEIEEPRKLSDFKIY